MKFNFRKIASAASSLLLGVSTVALAAAANYPAPFVQNGKADVAIVVGQSAATSDMSAATALSADLGTAFVSQGGSSSSSTVATTTGEVFPLFTSSTELYLNDSINVARSILTDDDLPSVLGDGEFSGNVDAEYTQTITLNGANRILFGQEPSSEDDPTVYLDIGTSAAGHLYNSTVVFDQAINFSHADSNGESLTLFGKEWTVGADTDFDELVLYKSSEKILLSLGGASPSPSKTVTVDGSAYTIELVSGSDTDATVKVTDSSGHTESKEINEDQSKKVNGIEISVASADESEALGSVNVEVTVASDKVTLQDGSEVRLGTNEDPLDGTTVDFIGTTSTHNISQIRISVYAEDSDTDAIIEGGSFLDPVYGSFKVDFTALNIPSDSTSNREDLSVSYSGDDELRLSMTSHTGDAKSFTYMYNASGSSVLAYGDQGNERIIVREMAQVNKSMYVVVGNQDEGYILEVSTISNSTGSGNTYSDDQVELKDVFKGNTYSATITAEGTGTVTIGGKTFTVTYVDDRTVSGDEYVRLNYPDSGTSGHVIIYPTIETSKGAKVAFYEPLNISLSNLGDGTAISRLMLPDGDDYVADAVDITLGTASGSLDGNFTVEGVAINQTANTGFVPATAVTVGQLVFNFTWGGVNTTRVFLVDPRGGNVVDPALIIWEEEEDTNDREHAIVVLSDTGGVDADGVGVNTVVSTAGLGGAATYTTLESNDDWSQLMTLYGSIVTIDNGESDQNKATISYPDDQVQAMIYLSEGEATVSDGNSGVLGNIVVKDSEVSSVSSKNLVVLGGSCINTAASKLLGSSSPLCGADFTAKTGVNAGSYVIQSFASPWSSSKVALLVAGYNAEDTTNAANALKSNTIDTMTGKKYTGSTATSVTPVLS